jgi:alkylation response protein AidB-like acyl-CoA dehydrogenase
MDDQVPEALAAAAERGIEAVRAIVATSADPERYDPAVPDALRAAGLHLLPVPSEHGGLGANLEAAVRVLAGLGAVDGSAALGYAMHVQVVGGAAEAGIWPTPAFDHLIRAILDDGAFVNGAGSEEGSGSPARGGLPDTRAIRDGDGWRVTGEKTFTTWLPALRFALVSARLVEEADDASDPPRLGNLLVDLDSPGVERREGFDALGMRASSSGRLRLTNVAVPMNLLVTTRRAGDPDPRGASAQAWFASCIAAVYLGIGEGARAEVVRWAVDRRPGDGSTAVADIPAVQVRLGRLDAALRAARVLLLDVARRWDAASPADRPGLISDVHLAKVRVANAAVEATDEALRIAGGPGYLTGRLERAFRDARAGLINPPLDDVAYQGFAQALVRRQRL